MQHKLSLQLSSTLFFTIAISLLSISINTADAAPNTDQLINEFLEGEHTRNFLSNDDSGYFSNFFGNEINIDLYNKNILISSNTDVIINGDELQEYATIFVEGTLRIYKTDSNPLYVQKIIVAPNGKLIIGTNEEPIQTKEIAEIIFKKQYGNEIGIFVLGTFVAHGRDLGTTFVELGNSPNKNDYTVVVNESIKKWQKGDRVVITTPGLSYDDKCSILENNISEITGTFVTLSKPLSCDILGNIGDANLPRSHMSSLSRNIIFSSFDSNARGSINFQYGSSGYIKYVQLDNLGPENTIGRYPIHFHHMHDTSQGIEIIGNSIINSYNRWITIHDSNGIMIKDNVGYGTVGHGYFLEDGTEFENVLDHNIGIKNTRGSLIKSDGSSGIFWISNPANYFRNNVAVNGFYFGYYLQIPYMWIENPTSGDEVNLKSLPLLEFDNNQSYNSNRAGLFIGRTFFESENLDLAHFLITNFKTWNTHFNDPQSYNSGISINTNNVTIQNSYVYNSATGISLIGDSNIVENTQIVNSFELEKPAVSGILIGGKDNIIQNSLVKGYEDQINNNVSDISLAQDLSTQISATIIDTILSDPRPIIFGTPENALSYLVVVGFDAPALAINDYSEDFVLHHINYEIPEQNTELFIDNNFIASVESLDSFLTHANNFVHEKEISQNTKSSDLMINFKNYAIGWKNNLISDEDFKSSIDELITVGKIKIINFNIDNVSQQQYHIPIWVKHVVGFWESNLISDDELFDALEYVITNQIIANEPRNSYD